MIVNREKMKERNLKQIDEEDEKTPEEMTRLQTEKMDHLVHFTPEEKARWEAERLRSIRWDIEQAERQAIRKVAEAELARKLLFKDQRATTKLKRAEWKVWVDAEALALERELAAFRAFKESHPEPVMSGRDDPLLITDYEVIKEEKP